VRLDLKDLKVQREHKEQLDQLDLKERKEQLDQLDLKERKELRVLTEHKVQLDQQDLREHKVRQALGHKEHKELQVREHKEHKEHLDQRHVLYNFVTVRRQYQLIRSRQIPIQVCSDKGLTLSDGQSMVLSSLE